MALMIWGPMFEVGVHEIDTQHRQLFNLANELAEAIMQRREQDILIRILAELTRYTQTHFTTEEQLMTRHQYPGAEAHRRQHQELVHQVEQLRLAVQEGQPDAADKVLKLFTGWLAEHIMHIDKALARDLQQKGLH